MSEPRAAREAGPPPSDPLGPQAAQLVERLLDDAARRGEALLCWVRAAVCAAALARLAWFSGHTLLALDVRDLLDTATLLAGIGGSFVVFRFVRRGAPLRPLASASVVLDALIVFELLLTTIVWHASWYTGVIQQPAFAALLLAVFSIALRLSVRGTILGVAAHAVSLAALLVADRLFGGKLAYGASGIVLAWILFGGAAALAGLLSRRTRQLVLAAASATIRAEHVRQRLGAYLSEEVAEQSLRRGALALGGVRQEIAVLFSDLRGFTGWSEKQVPESLVAELNGYFEAMMPAIRAHGGVVDKYIGDSIMVVFGVPQPGADDAARAVRTAAAMQQSLAAHNRQRVGRGLPELVQGIGVHFGPAIAGNIGTAERLQYTVVGDTVNLASRLEAATKEQGVAVLISAPAVEAARLGGGGNLPSLEPAGSVHVRGREAPVDVFTIPG